MRARRGENAVPKVGRHVRADDELALTQPCAFGCWSRGTGRTVA